MTTFRIYRIDITGGVRTELANANDWQSLITQIMWSNTDRPIFRIEVIGSNINSLTEKQPN